MSDKKKVIVDSVEAKSPQEIQDIYNEELIRKSAAPITTADLIKSVTGAVQAGKRIPRLAFNENPIQRDSFAGVFKFKSNLLPSAIIKKIRVQNLLVAAIVRTRGFQMSMFGHPKNNRFDIGIEIKIKKQFKDSIEPEELQHIKERMDNFTKLLMDCGKTDGLKEKEKTTFSEFLSLQTQNGVSFGWFGTELIWEDTEYKKLHRFRPVDAGTIHHAIKKGEGAEGTRQSSLRWLEEQQNVKIDKDVLQKGEYDYVQVIDGMPRQAFTSKELIMYNLYPSTDIEHNNYPVTPLDTVINAVTTHSSIEVYNKLYFQNGKSAKGMLVIKSDNIDENTIQDMKQQFQASINNVNNSFKIPIFGVSREDEVQWMSTMPNRKDGEFEYLFDQTTRNILAAFNMSPDELPGFAHLSKGTNQQSLCLDLTSRIYTPEGMMTLGDILKERDEVFIKVWTGLNFVEARVFKSGEKRQIRTKLTNGVELISSPDHRFKVIGEDGEPTWKRQEELTTDDWVLVNRKPVESDGKLPSYNGMVIEEDLAEVLGWMIGDGCLSLRHNKNTKNIKSGIIDLFYHHEKERDLWVKHSEILKKYNLNVLHKETVLSDEQVEGRRSYINATKASNVKITNQLYDTDFVRFLLSLGFKTSKEGKEIPSFLYTAPEGFRSSFLRGFFSADGCLRDGSLSIQIHNHTLRNQTKDLLLSLGIRVQSFEGRYKIHPITKIKTESKTKLNIKDKVLFYERVGFLQKHKQPSLEMLCPTTMRWEKTSPFTIEKYVKSILKTDDSVRVLSKSERNNLYTILNPNISRNASLFGLKITMQKVGMDIPSWMDDFYTERVSEIEDLKQYAPMADVEVFDKEHAFIANGIVVHNSESSSEYKLTAQRDSGIRPLILKFQDYLNEKLFPLLDPELSQLCDIHFSGLDAETRQQESNLLQAEMPIHMTYDEVMDVVDKDAIGEEWGGKFPLSERYQMVIDKYSDVSDIISKFYKTPSALVDPMLKYKRDSFWFQNLQLLAEMNPNAVKAFFAPKPHALDILKLNVQDMIDEEEGLS